MLKRTSRGPELHPKVLSIQSERPLGLCCDGFAKLPPVCMQMQGITLNVEARTQTCCAQAQSTCGNCADNGCRAESSDGDSRNDERNRHCKLLHTGPLSMEGVRWKAST